MFLYCFIVFANRQQTKGTKMYLQVSKIHLFLIQFACYFSFFRKQMPLWSRLSTASTVLARKTRCLHSCLLSVPLDMVQDMFPGTEFQDLETSLLALCSPFFTLHATYTGSDLLSVNL